MFLKVFWVFVATLMLRANGANGDWRLQYPPWGEPGLPTTGSPQIWFPLIGPFTRHSCFPSRYMSMRIAVSHINRRDATFCPAIATLQNNFEFRYDAADSNANGIGAARALLRVLGDESKDVKVVLGPNSSGSSKSMSDLLAVFNTPHISWAATNGDLSNKAAYPMFFRIVSPDSLAMKVLAGWISSLGFKKCNLAYFDADFQSGQARDFLGPAQATYAIEVNSFKMPNSGKGGTAVSVQNTIEVQRSVNAIRDTGVRVIVSCVINEEAYDFFRAAYDAGIYAAEGFIWFGTDGLSGGQLAGQIERLKYFAGSLFVQVIGEGPSFGDYVDRWSQLMPITDRPEFTQFDLCLNSSTDRVGICKDNPDFKGWKDDTHGQELICKGYTGLAYDAVVTLAVVADRMIAKGISAQAATSQNWLDEMKALSTPGFSFDCLTGKVSFNANQERDMQFAFNNWHPSSLNFVEVARWDGVDGYGWTSGATVVWPSGQSDLLIGTPPHPASIPTGAPPTCDQGMIYNNTAMTCTDCPPGTFHDGSACVLCHAGRVAQAGQTQCIVCLAGRYAPGAGQSECGLCMPGKFSESDASSCELCPAGSSTHLWSQQGCERCKMGNFSDVPGSVNCTRCPGDLSTEYPGASAEVECACPAGYFRDVENRFRCHACLEGMTCSFGADAANFGWNGTSPQVNKGYYTEAEEPLSVFLCLDTPACPGGAPGSCNGGKVNLACSMCPDNHYYNGQLCLECKPLARVVLGIVVVACVVGITCMYYFSHDEIFNDVSPGEKVVVCVSMLVTVFQLMGSLHQLPLPWPSSSNSNLEAGSYLLFDPDSLQAECFLGAGAFKKYMSRVIVPYFLLALVLIGKCFSKALSQFFKVEAWNTDKVIQTMGQISQALFIAFAAIVAIPFQCYSHPNGERSVASFPQVICGAADHLPLIILSFVLLLTFIMPYLATTLWANWTAPSKSVHQHSHIVRFHFLFSRFRCNVWWWGSLVSFRQLCFAFSTMVDPDDAYAQITYVVTVLWVYVAFAIYFWPWKCDQLNILESSSLVCMALFVLLVGAFAPETKSPDAYNVLMIIVLGFILTSTGSCILVYFWSFLAHIRSSRRGGLEPESARGSRSSRKNESLAQLWLQLCIENVKLDVEQISFLFLAMNRYDKSVLRDVIDLFSSLNTDVLDQTGQPEHTRRITNTTSMKMKLRRSPSKIEKGWKDIARKISGAKETRVESMCLGDLFRQAILVGASAAQIQDALNDGGNPHGNLVALIQKIEAPDALDSNEREVIHTDSRQSDEVVTKQKSASDIFRASCRRFEARFRRCVLQRDEA